MKVQLNQAIDYIGRNVEEICSLDKISKEVGVSKYYLNHLFKIYTGRSIMEYTRLKKLEHAIAQLKESRSILDIAMSIGYSSERSFARAVVQAFGHPPSYFRIRDLTKSRKVKIYDLALNISEEQILQGFSTGFNQIKNELIKKGVHHMKSYLSDVRYEIIPPMTVISAIAKGEEPENEIINLMNQLISYYQLQVLRRFGFDSPVEESHDVQQYRGYEYWLSVNEDELRKLPTLEDFDFFNYRITIKKIPSYRYACLRITNPFENPFERIGGGWRFLVSWLEDHDFKEPDFNHIPCAHCLEEVKDIEGITYMDLFIPVDIA